MNGCVCVCVCAPACVHACVRACVRACARVLSKWRMPMARPMRTKCWTASHVQMNLHGPEAMPRLAPETGHDKCHI